MHGGNGGFDVALFWSCCAFILACLLLLEAWLDTHPRLQLEAADPDASAGAVGRGERGEERYVWLCTVRTSWCKDIAPSPAMALIY